MDTITPEYETIEIETSGRRRKITKFALAGVAVLGVGAALTSAAWTDNVWFGGDAASGVADLQGSVDGTNFEDGDDVGGLDLEMGTFRVAPTQTATDTVWVLNNGDVPMRLSVVEPVGTGGLFNGPQMATVSATAAITELAAGQSTAITVTVTAPDWDEDDYEALAGRIVLHVEGTTDLTP